MTRPLSKSKLIAYRQCPRRLWLEVHRPDLREDSAATEAIFASGHQVGELAQHLFDPLGQGQVIDLHALGVKAALAKTTELIHAAKAQPVFEAGFSADPHNNGGALAFADILLPEVTENGARTAWHMVEVKSSTSVKDYYREDVAIQHYVATHAGLKLASIAIAVIDNQWMYPGGGHYQGLLKTEDLTAASLAMAPLVQAWIADAQAVVQQTQMPACSTGPHCDTPFACGFYTHCATQEGRMAGNVAHPIHWLPYARPVVWQAEQKITELAQQVVQDVGKGVLNSASTPGSRPWQSMLEVPDHLLNQVQKRVKHAHQTGQAFMDWQGLSQALSPCLPNASQAVYFLDFETVMPAIPVWAGTRPYETLVTQYSCHQVKADGSITHTEFLDTSGADPRAALTDHLLQTLGEISGLASAAPAAPGPIFTYSAYERTQLRQLAQALPQYGPAIERVIARLVDLLPIARAYVYHPAQQGSWSIKSVLPALLGQNDPRLSYEQLSQSGQVANGGDAQLAFMEAIAPATPAPRRQELHTQLLSYCQLDTYAMVRLWHVFTRQSPMVNSP